MVFVVKQLNMHITTEIFDLLQSSSKLPKKIIEMAIRLIKIWQTLKGFFDMESFKYPKSNMIT